MKPGYYISETGNFQIWYPKDFFTKGEQRMDVVGADSLGQVFVKEHHFLHFTVELMEDTLEFEYIGEL
jgi:hypothetical protein